MEKKINNINELQYFLENNKYVFVDALRKLHYFENIELYSFRINMSSFTFEYEIYDHYFYKKVFFNFRKNEESIYIITAQFSILEAFFLVEELKKYGLNFHICIRIQYNKVIKNYFELTGTRYAI